MSETTQQDTAGVPAKGRRGDGGVYLVVADETDEFNLALRYAARLARLNRGHVCILHVITIEDFQHWPQIEEKIRTELRAEAERRVLNNARKVHELTGQCPGIYIREGSRADSLVDVINEDMAIRMLILGGGMHPTGPGPLVSHFTGKGLGRLRVPIVVVPGHLDPKKIDAIT